MKLGRYLFSLVLDDDAVLPEYKGSTFRGIFGHFLKRVVCALKQQECADCLLREKCVYFQVFELHADPAPADCSLAGVFSGNPFDSSRYAASSQIREPFQGGTAVSSFRQGDAPPRFLAGGVLRQRRTRARLPGAGPEGRRYFRQNFVNSLV